MISACDVGFDAIGLVQGICDQGGRDLGCVDVQSGDGDRGVCDDIQRGKFIFVRCTAI